MFSEFTYVVNMTLFGSEGILTKENLHLFNGYNATKFVR